MAVYVLTFIVAFIQLMLGVELMVADVMLLLNLYNVASRTRWTIAVPSTLALIVWVMMASVPLISKSYLSIGELAVLLLAVVWVCTWGVLVRTRRKYMQALRDRTKQLERERHAEARVAAAQERARIAREIHDVVSHNIGAVGILADGAVAKVETDPDMARTAMLRVRDTSRKALAEMRTMLGLLRNGEDPEEVTQPGLDQLDALVAEFRSLGVPAKLTILGERPAEITSGIQLAVYRVVQEALTNVRKHAGEVSHVAVKITFTPDEIEVRVDNDGRGFTDHAGAGASNGHGLVGMRERVHAYGGRFEAGMRPAGGYQVRAWLPLAIRQEEQV
ncbi:sensor histidine kinase [Auritidibacter ignavus]|uniref:sensor histidine kinase n=1 Tax=Auritidibacter ignavus TaxID=678932 RepID=UPI0024BAACFA|nr:sensor histidine kinase [Auritidibacter ignavus]WHS27769.1 sensor histidine kinase [Auritidibacter ignavus]